MVDKLNQPERAQKKTENSSVVCQNKNRCRTRKSTKKKCIEEGHRWETKPSCLNSSSTGKNSRSICRPWKDRFGRRTLGAITWHATIEWELIVGKPRFSKIKTIAPLYFRGPRIRSLDPHLIPCERHPWLDFTLTFYTNNTCCAVNSPAKKNKCNRNLSIDKCTSRK